MTVSYVADLKHDPIILMKFDCPHIVTKFIVLMFLFKLNFLTKCLSTFPYKLKSTKLFWL